jgi:MFS family permease
VLLGVSVLWIPLAFLFDGITVLVLPIRLSGGATDIGLVSFIGLAFGAAVQPVVGWLSDRFRHVLDRRVVAAGAAVPAIAGVWLLVGTVGVAGAIVAYAVVQIAAASIQAGQQTLIPEHVRPRLRGRAAGLKTAFDVGGSFVAFLALGAVIAAGGLVDAAVATTVAVVAAVVVMLLLVPPRVARPVPRPPIRPLELPAGLGSLIASRFLFLLATYAVGRFLLLLVAERLAIPPERAADEAGGLLALFTLVTALAAIAFGWLADRFAQQELMVVGALVAGVGIAVLVPAAGAAGLVAGGLVMSIGTAAFVTANWAATTAVVPPADAGRLMGIANLGTAVAAAVAGLVGPLIDLAGFAPALVVAALVSATAAIPLLTAPRRTRSVESPT